MTKPKKAKSHPISLEQRKRDIDALVMIVMIVIGVVWQIILWIGG